MKALEVVTSTLVLLVTLALGGLFRGISHRHWNTPGTVFLREFVGILLVLSPPTIMAATFHWPVLRVIALAWGSAVLIGILVLACDRAFGVVGGQSWEGVNSSGDLKRRAKHQLEDLSAEIFDLILQQQTMALELDEQQLQAAEALVRTSDLRNLAGSFDAKTMRHRALDLLANLEGEICNLSDEETQK